MGPFQATIELKCHIRIVTWILFILLENNYDGVNQSVSITTLRYKYVAKFVLLHSCKVHLFPSITLLVAESETIFYSLLALYEVLAISDTHPQYDPNTS